MTFTEEILNGKLHFLCSASWEDFCLSTSMNKALRSCFSFTLLTIAEIISLIEVFVVFVALCLFFRVVCLH